MGCLWILTVFFPYSRQSPGPWICNDIGLSLWFNFSHQFWNGKYLCSYKIGSILPDSVLFILRCCFLFYWPGDWRCCLAWCPLSWWDVIGWERGFRIHLVHLRICSDGHSDDDVDSQATGSSGFLGRASRLFPNMSWVIVSSSVVVWGNEE